ncbi:hypothetical protein ZWY2020_011153 [Hordeum vulgare]|nr:hypothetical protein ZWY2020_011153 [Hordeum vulgare]
MSKNFECSNVRPIGYVKFATFQLKSEAAEWWQQLKDSRADPMISWDDFYCDFKAHHIPASFVEGMCEKFTCLKQGSSSMYNYNIEFQNLACYAKQDVRDGKSKIYQFRSGVKEDLQISLDLHAAPEIVQFDNFTLMAESALLVLILDCPKVADVLGSSSASSISAVQAVWWSWIFPPTQPNFPVEISAS